MVQGQRCTLQIRPEYGYRHKKCQMQPPKGADADEQLQFDVELLEIYSKDDVRVVGSRDDIYKTVKRRSESWETPREPYEVHFSICDYAPSNTLLHPPAACYIHAVFAQCTCSSPTSTYCSRSFWAAV